MRDTTIITTSITEPGVFQIQFENKEDKYYKFKEISLNDQQSNQNIMSRLIPDERQEYIKLKIEENLPSSYLVSNITVFSAMSLLLISIQIVMFAYNAALNEICTGIWAAFIYLIIAVADFFLGKALLIYLKAFNSYF